MPTSKISIIVPVYNIAPYLSSCLESLVSQDYDNIEIIVIDDGSIDGSGDIVDDFARRYAQIKVVHQPNAGVSAARNYGLELATGDWIMFVDGDDVIESDTCSSIMAHILKFNPDIVMFEYSVDRAGKQPIPHLFRTEEAYGTLTRPAAVKLLYTGAPFAVCKVYARKLLVEIKFSSDIFRGEDTMFALQVFHKAKTVSSLREVYYHYIQSENSAARGKINARQLTGIEALKWMLDFADTHYPELHGLAARGYVNIMAEFYIQMYIDGYHDQRRKEQIIRGTRRYILDVLKEKQVDMKQKIKLLLFVCSPGLFCWILSHTRKGRM